jgi:ABC-type transport system involved in cytochrome c biogenesis permease subunit
MRFWFTLSLFLTLFSFSHAEEWTPVAYQGRFRPAEAYARLWLYDLYHSQSLKKSHLEAFNTSENSALDLMWSLHIKGASPFEASPLFWLQSAQLKQLAGLDLTHNHFSYSSLHHAFDLDPQTSVKLLTPLLLYHALQAYTDSTNRSLATKWELNKLAPGLWLQFQGQDLVVVAAPPQLPWKHFVRGQIIASNVRDRAIEEMASTKTIAEEISTIRAHLVQFKSLQGTKLPQETALQNSFEKIRHKKNPKEIEQSLEQQYPLLERLRMAGSILKVLPGRYPDKDWFSLHALKVRIYDPLAQDLVPLANFTLFSDADFKQLRQDYLAWEKSILTTQSLQASASLHKQMLETLQSAYSKVAGHTYQRAHDTALAYPSINQMKWESFYYRYPLLPVAIALYALAALLLGLGQSLKIRSINQIGFVFFGCAFAWHTFILALRCYILQRPPVSNMFETLIYVPWIAVALSLTLRQWSKNNLIVIAAALAALILLVLLQVTDLNSSLENVQPVLNSQFWLLIHVLMIVGSYGVFILGGVLGHLYLILNFFKRQAALASIHTCILQTLYLGTALLISGTLLGGAWAAESWGRFWDWDPKESWAFISSCVYLIIIHAYRFHKIGSFGLAVGSVLGLMAISFTWYGVNYILGTGLHSYGFGSGGQHYYYLYLLVEALFLTVVAGMHRKILIKDF